MYFLSKPCGIFGNHGSGRSPQARLPGISCFLEASHACDEESFCSARTTVHFPLPSVLSRSLVVHGSVGCTATEYAESHPSSDGHARTADVRAPRSLPLCDGSAPRCPGTRANAILITAILILIKSARKRLLRGPWRSREWKCVSWSEGGRGPAGKRMQLGQRLIT